MRAVIWTDVFQSVIILGGLLAILIKVSKLMETVSWTNSLILKFI